MKLPPAPRVLDLGANGGGFPLMLALADIHPSRLVCVEMNPLTHRRLQLNLATNFGVEAVALSAAVCGAPRSAVLIKPTRGGTGDSIGRLATGEPDANVAVPAMTLSAIYMQYFAPGLVDLCKIDIEGEEFALFASTPDELLQRIRYLIMEMHFFDDAGRANAKRLVGRLQSLGFEEIVVGRNEGHGGVAEVRAFAGPAAQPALPSSGIAAA